MICLSFASFSLGEMPYLFYTACAAAFILLTLYGIYPLLYFVSVFSSRAAGLADDLLYLPAAPVSKCPPKAYQKNKRIFFFQIYNDF